MPHHNQRLIGSSFAMNQVLEHTSRLAEINRPVLICGERGSGKELIAQRLHYLSGRWDQAFISVNCAALSETLIESELFGHEAGAFTGANKTHIGRFERAHGGTLFLDELGTMSATVQEKLLRLIEYGEFERLGSQKRQQVDVRIIAATHADLPALCLQGKFRADLLDRLAFDVIQIPPLRERLEDLDELATFFAHRFCIELGWPDFAGLSPAALALLHQYHWPGNVRELKNVIERSLYRQGPSATPLATLVINPFPTNQPVSPPPTRLEPPSSTDHSQPDHSDNRLQVTISTEQPLKQSVQALQHLLLQHALKRHGNQHKAATALGLSYDQFRGLWRSLKDYKPL